MTLTNFWPWLEETSLAQRIGESWWFPLLESIHVVAIVMVIGSILMVDLRLIGIAARSYTVSRMSKELVPWTWVAFAISVVTGVGLFITRAAHYVDNIAFQAKFVLLILAGINMALFHFGVFRTVNAWDSATPPSIAKASAALSLVLWSGVVLAGRWVGHLS
ncbi:MAG TPA: DUF6644 family protein [Steroidobacteraceae bacterium]|nr:DUF6644 family protein [Steroidobacteraceae bacterium]